MTRKATAGAVEASTRYGINLDLVPSTDPDGMVDIEDVYTFCRTVAAARRAAPPAAPSGPWAAGEHPVDWAYRTERVAATSVDHWKARYASDPAGVGRTLTELTPVLGIRPGGVSAAAVKPPQRGATGYLNGVEELRAEAPRQVASAVTASSPPPLFPGNGDYPLATASGVPPAALAHLPWRARLAAAWEPDTARVMEMARQYAGPDGEVMAAYELANNPAVGAYVASVQEWYVSAGTHEAASPEAADEAYRQMYGEV